MTTKRTLREHIKIKHQGYKYNCHICSKVYSSSQEVKIHIKSAHEGKRYECNICTSVFTLKACLLRHMKTQHFPELHSCKICDYKTGRTQCLKRHVDYVHKNKTTTCLECNKSVRNLHQHQKRIHSEKGTTYPCKICSYQTGIKVDLNAHIKRVHTYK